MTTAIVRVLPVVGTDTANVFVLQGGDIVVQGNLGKAEARDLAQQLAKWAGK